MNTLIIHPTDPTTDFLKGLYIEGATIINDPKATKRSITNALKSHDRIILMGHGYEKGLFADTGTYWPRVIIDPSHVDILRKKGKTIIGIWCYASTFFQKYGLRGFATGMFISEPSEVQYCLGSSTKDYSTEIDESNKLFVDSFKGFDYDNLMEKYLPCNDIQTYNREKFYITQNARISVSK